MPMKKSTRVAKKKSSRKTVTKPKARLRFKLAKLDRHPDPETWFLIHKKYGKRPYHITQEQIDMEQDLEREHMD